ncbi:hypothetical protein BJF92_11375 [Rhizobium rhizosphaerae]|uniref:Uncharacterized protein n=2 Tax=Xaviernesmea rhizosphaerae TaxID=1672749 RepID=A0A1Q9AMS2_9HYPH|nr:hypothetical protein BJF92_11375 [Xaviernesmea rhizosphaerae]
MSVCDIMGDSRAAQAGVAVFAPPARHIGLSNLYWLNWANVLTGQRMSINRLFASSGKRTDEYINLFKSARVASDAGWAIWNYPLVNNLAQAEAGYTHAVTGATITTANVAAVAFADLQAEWESDLAAGKRLILLTEPGATNLSAASVQALHDFNLRLKCWAEGKPGVYLFDFCALLWAATQSGSLIRFKPGVLQPSDPTHYSALGAYTVGKAFADFLRSNLPARDRAIAGVHEARPANPRQIVANPFFITTSGGATGANMTVSSGTVPGNTAISATAACSVAISNADADSGNIYGGKAITYALTAGAAATVARIAADSPPTSYWSVSDILETGVEIDVAANAGGAHVYSTLEINTDKGSKNAWSMYGLTSQGAGPTEAYHMSMRTEPEPPIDGSVTVGYAAPIIYVALAANATCSISVQRQWGYRRYPATPLPAVPVA